MAKKEELHLLIKSLSKSEKRHFKLFCKREESGSNYLLVFDLIDQQPNYDHQKLKEALKDKPFAKQLHVTKNYLRHLILKSLRNFHAKNSKDAEVKALLQNSEILFHKELYSLCGQELERALKICNDYELLASKVEVLTWQRKLEQALNPNNFNRFASILQDQKQTIDQVKNQNDYWQLAVQTSEGIINANLKDKQKKIKPPKSLEAEVMANHSEFLRQVSKNHIPEAEEKLHAILKLLEAHPHRLKEEPGLYVSTLNNLLSFLTFQKKYTEAFALIAKAKNLYETLSIKSENKGLLKQILRTYNIELEIIRDQESLSPFVTQIEKTSEFVEKYQFKMPIDYLHSFWFQLASIQFNRKEFSVSLSYINKLLNTRVKDPRVDLQISARILNLMVHLERQNLFVLRYFVDSAKRYLKKQKSIQAHHQVLLNFFKRMGHLPLLEYKDAYRKLHQSIFPEGEESLIPNLDFETIDYKKWIEERM